MMCRPIIIYRNLADCEFNNIQVQVLVTGRTRRLARNRNRQCWIVKRSANIFTIHGDMDRTPSFRPSVAPAMNFSRNFFFSFYIVATRIATAIPASDRMASSILFEKRSELVDLLMVKSYRDDRGDLFFRQSSRWFWFTCYLSLKVC